MPLQPLAPVRGLERFLTFAALVGLPCRGTGRARGVVLVAGRGGGTRHQPAGRGQIAKPSGGVPRRAAHPWAAQRVSGPHYCRSPTQARPPVSLVTARLICEVWLCVVCLFAPLPGSYSTVIVTVAAAASAALACILFGARGLAMSPGLTYTNRRHHIEVLHYLHRSFSGRCLSRARGMRGGLRLVPKGRAAGSGPIHAWWGPLCTTKIV